MHEIVRDVNGVGLELLGEDFVIEIDQGLVAGVVARHHAGRGCWVNVVRKCKDAHACGGIGILHGPARKKVIAHLHAGFNRPLGNLEKRHIAATLIDVMLRGENLGARRNKADGQVLDELAPATAEESPPGIVRCRDDERCGTFLQVRYLFAPHAHLECGTTLDMPRPELPPLWRANHPPAALHRNLKRSVALMDFHVN